MDIVLNKNQKSVLVFFLLSVFLISLAYSFYFRISPAADARAYDNIAWNLVQGNGYRETLDTPIQQDNSIIRVGPGYEFFLAVIYYIFGHHYEAVWIIQAFLMALSALLVFLTTKEIFQTRWNFLIGMFAAILVGFSPDLITMQGMLMTEVSGVFFVILTSYLFCRYYNADAKLSDAKDAKIYYDFNAGSKSWVLAVFLGLSLGMAALVRTPAAFLFFPIAGYLFLNKNWRHFLLIGIAVAALFSPWIARNYRIFGVFMPTNAAAGFNLLTGNHPGATGEQGDFDILSRYPAGLDGFRVNELATDDALKFILSNPLEFIKLTLYRISIYFSFARPTGFWFHLFGWNKALTLIASAFYAVLLFTFGLFGIWQIKNLSPFRRFSEWGEAREKKLAYYFLAMLVMMPLAIAGIIIETRYRMLVYPFFAVFAGYGLDEFLTKRVSWKLALYLASPLFFNAIFDILRNWSRIVEKIQNL